jgi:uncharacterized protein (DUF2252 family)
MNKIEQNAGVIATRSARADRGKSRRRAAPRRSPGDWKPAGDRADPIDLLQEQDESRIQRLLPIKYGRMVESPFAFLRGSAVVMAADLSDTPVSAIDTLLCGDAHLSNFGVFATPERQLAFDINDFDETYPGPWEWDLKRLAASATVAGRANGLGDSVNRDLAERVARAYQAAMRHFSDLTTLDMWYYHVSAEDVLGVFRRHSSKKARKGAEKIIAKARKRTQEQTLEKLTFVEDGRRRFSADPPLLVPIRTKTFHEIFDDGKGRTMTPDTVEQAWLAYLDTLSTERRFLLQRYNIVDAALRVGGVGSVGTRCFIVLLEGQGVEDAIILQQKEAGPSALERYLPKRTFKQQAERVVNGQRVMQASSDLFLGWHSATAGEFDIYWRQLKDMKGSFAIETLDKHGLATYVTLCSWCLARAHACAGDALQTAAYLGKGDAFAKAIGQFALAYADQTERDHEVLVAAVNSGRIAAERGV